MCKVAAVNVFHVLATKKTGILHEYNGKEGTTNIHKHIIIIIIIIILFYIALFSALEQTHCAHVACDSE